MFNQARKSVPTPVPASRRRSLLSEGMMMLRLDDVNIQSPGASQPSSATGVSAAASQPRQHNPPSPMPISTTLASSYIPSNSRSSGQNGPAESPVASSSFAAGERPSANFLGAASAPPCTMATASQDSQPQSRLVDWTSSLDQPLLDHDDHRRIRLQMGTSLYGTSPQMQPPSPLHLMSLGEGDHFLHSEHESRGRSRTRSSVSRFHGWTAPETLREVEGDESSGHGSSHYKTDSSSSIDHEKH